MIHKLCRAPASIRFRWSRLVNLNRPAGASRASTVNSLFHVVAGGAVFWAGRETGGQERVVDPHDADQQVFTEAGAWEFIAELLEAGHPIQEIELDNPAGKRGYVLVA